MKHRLTGLLCGGLLLVSLPAAASAATKVGVRVEGAKTLVSGRTVTLGAAPVVKDGNAAHACSADSAAGALEVATGGDWAATWSDGLGYFANAIRGERPTGSAFFSLWVNEKLSATGLCDTKLRAGDDVLMFVDRCDEFDNATQACKDALAPLRITAPRSARRGRTVTIRVASLAPSGTATPEAGASVYANGRRIGRTDRAGRMKVRGARAGRVSFRAAEKGRVRSAVVTTRITRR